ncbi:MAG TPA: hypothetical protein VK638_19740 [Edaphobacter sp.]|nr:hypothetical protein [Edaphobacter sp.]
MAHSSVVRVEERPLSSREAELTHSLTSINPEWAGVNVAALRIIGECRCGCQSVVFAKPPEPQSVLAVGHQNLVGEMSLSIRTASGDDTISVLLHYADGSLSLLEVIWYNFPDPIPDEWTELRREITIR